VARNKTRSVLHYYSTSNVEIMCDITPARLQKVLQQLKSQSPLAGATKTEQIKNSLKEDGKQ